MPTIDQLPAGQVLSTSDEIPVSQTVDGQQLTGKVQLGALLALLAAAGIEPSSFIVGQGVPGTGTGNDRDGYVNASTGDLYSRSAGTWTKIGSLLGPRGLQGDAQPAFSAALLNVVNLIGSSDLVPIGQSGSTVAIPYASFLNAETIDQLDPAANASDADTLLVAQGGNVLLRQSLGAVWTLIAAHLPGYHRPVLELTANTTLDGSTHNNALLVCSKPITLSPSGTMGSGFACDVVNVSGSDVTLGAGFVTSNAGTVLPTGEHARIFRVQYSGGAVNFAVLSAGSGGSAPALPGQVTGLSSAGTTESSVSLSWTASGSGGQVTSYAINYRQTGASSWTAAPGSPGSASLTTFTVTGLAASTGYDFQVIPQNSAGSGTAATLTGISTASAPAAPGPPTLSAGSPTNSTIPLSWTAPTSGGAVSTYTVFYRVSGAGSWNTATASLGFGTLTYTITGLTASTTYDVYVAAVNLNGATASNIATVPTTAAGAGYLLTPGFQPVAGATWPAGTTNIGCNVNDNSASGDGSHTAPNSLSFGWSTSNTTAPTTNLTGAAWQFANGGHNYWAAYPAAPSVPGTYYLWAIAYDSGSTIVATCPSTNSYVVT